MDAFTSLAILILVFVMLVIFTKKEEDLKEDPAKVHELLNSTQAALTKAEEYVGEEKLPHKVIGELDSSLCKLMCNIRKTKEENTKVSVLYGHFKHVLDEFLQAGAHTKEYEELKHHLEEQYDHIHHELVALSHEREMTLAGAHGH